MLRQWMNTDDDVRAPALEEFNHVANASLMEELACFGTKAVHAPVNIFHPMLLVPEHPVVEGHHLRGDRMRLFNCANNTHGIGPPVEKLLHAGDNRCCR